MESLIWCDHYVFELFELFLTKFLVHGPPAKYFAFTLYESCSLSFFAGATWPFSILADGYCYSIMISAFCRGGLFEEAKQLARDFEATYDKYDLVMLNTMLCAYCRAGEMESVMQMMRKMDELAISPDWNTFHILIKYFCKEKLYLLAYKTMEDMHNKGHQPEEVFWTSIYYFLRTNSKALYYYYCCCFFILFFIFKILNSFNIVTCFVCSVFLSGKLSLQKRVDCFLMFYEPEFVLIFLCYCFPSICKNFFLL